MRDRGVSGGDVRFDCNHMVRTKKGDAVLLAVAEGDVSHPLLAPLADKIRLRHPDISDRQILELFERDLTNTCPRCAS